MSALLVQEMTSTNDKQERFWQAVQSRDSQFDGRFVFAVSSTGIYCRPSCPARRPRRENVSFFSLPEAAEQSGFRPCKRCRPQMSLAEDPQISLVRRACRLLEEDLEETMDLERLGDRLGLSSFHLQRTFKSIMGVTPREYAEACRTNRFKTAVRDGKSVTTAMYDAGYGSSSRLYERANAELGMTPATYGRGGATMVINYAVAKTPLGYLLVAATSKGLCSVTLGDGAEELEANLKKEFIAANIHRDDENFKDTVEQIVAHLEGKQPHLSLPLDIRATAFQRQVWQALQQIPYGETLSYGEVATAIGRPTAVRAVARACATNPVALVVPCHRVIREDKSLGGYRWGLERKKSLLRAEKQARAKSADK
jgi:AraC family transcriptional regulator, regulatory protein of adaptative response / methylated-DNA-[protein]-cysteine methyltransferase